VAAAVASSALDSVGLKGAEVVEAYTLDLVDAHCCVLKRP
jgi:hypothetical protein